MANQSDNKLKLPDRVKQARRTAELRRVMGTGWDGFNAAVDRKLAEYDSQKKVPAPQALKKP